MTRRQRYDAPDWQRWIALVVWGVGAISRLTLNVLPNISA
jgi:hypothetical protein